jgi:hypothetical protein
MTTIYDARVAEMDASAATAGNEEAPLGSLQISAPSWGLAARAYERFLGMPVWVVLGVVWVGGGAVELVRPGAVRGGFARGRSDGLKSPQAAASYASTLIHPSA